MLLSEKYRPDIDGLRAVAILSVLLNHVGFPGFRGGFVGVDVFFVISGFLITRIISDEVHTTGVFDFKRFYIRRVRRLFPALAVTLVGTIIAGWFLLIPDLFEQAAKSIMAASISGSNIYFASDTGYFSAANILKPALHTWSLSVEEQFYVLWPCTLVFFLTSSARRVLLALLAVAALMSIFFAQYASDRAAPYYLTHYRIFEFAIGIALVWLRPLPQWSSPVIEELLLSAGLILIACAVVSFRQKTIIPGFAALLPCIGAALAIYAGRAKFVGLVLRNGAAVGIGLISYSLYLVHWPVIVFYRLAIGEVDQVHRIVIMSLSIAMASAMYHFIETPFRRGIAARPLVLSGAVALLTILAVGGAVVANNGFVWRYPASLAVALDPAMLGESQQYTWRRLRAADHAFDSKPTTKVLAIGDSQAGDFVNILSDAFGDRLDIAAFPSEQACQVLFSGAVYATLKEQTDCLARNRKLQHDRRIPNADVVALAFEWKEDALASLPGDIRRLKQLGARRVLVVGSKDQGFSGPELVARIGSLDGLEKYSAENASLKARYINSQLASLPGEFEYLDLMQLFCPVPDSCKVLDERLRPIFYDLNHITRAGSEYAARQLIAGEAAGDGSGPLLPISRVMAVILAK